MDYDKQMDTDDEGGKIVVEWEAKTEALLLGLKSVRFSCSCQWRYDSIW